ncbi:MAG: IS3 family transposase [Peptococcaceae bacterium]|nr:IS3 family transposase [Peptococcaceae bacterium]
MGVRRRYSGDFKVQVVLEILKEEKSISQLSSEYGIHQSQLIRWRQQAIQGLPEVLSDQKKAITQMKTQYEDKLQELYAEVGRLTTELTWLKKNLADSLEREQRLALLQLTDRSLPLNRQAFLLSLNRTGLYYQPVGPSPEEVAIKHRIDEIYTDHPYYGSRRITAQLRRDGYMVNRKAVVRHMQEMGISGICPGPNLSKRNQEHQVYPYLLRGVPIIHVNQVWGIDITYIRLMKGWMYLVAIIDWYSRYVISWQLDQTMGVSFVLEAVRRALQVATPVIMNSDQGSHFTSAQYLDLLKAANVRISMDGKGRATDNIFTERLWRSLKYEEVYLREYRTPRDAREGIGSYLQFYNEKRLHQSLDYRTPAECFYDDKKPTVAVE